MDKIKGLDAERAKSLLDDFMEVYMDKGFGLMNKTEIETLVYHYSRNMACLQASVLKTVSNCKYQKQRPENWFMIHRWNMPEEMKMN